MTKIFGAESTADEVLEGIDLSGKRVLVTGVSAGLGVETARTLVAHNATVVGSARDLNKARRALTEAFGQNSSDLPVDLVAAELASRIKEPGVRASAVDTGAIQAELARHLTPELIEQVMSRIRSSSGGSTHRFKTVPQGSATSVWSGFVASSDAVGGKYCED